MNGRFENAALGIFCAMVLDSLDAGADLAEFKAADLGTFEPFGFSRLARLPDEVPTRAHLLESDVECGGQAPDR